MSPRTRDSGEITMALPIGISAGTTQNEPANAGFWRYSHSTTHRDCRQHCTKWSRESWEIPIVLPIGTAAGTAQNESATEGVWRSHHSTTHGESRRRRDCFTCCSTLKLIFQCKKSFSWALIQKCSPLRGRINAAGALRARQRPFGPLSHLPRPPSRGTLQSYY